MADELHSSCGTQVMHCCDDVHEAVCITGCRVLGCGFFESDVAAQLRWALLQKFAGASCSRLAACFRGLGLCLARGQTILIPIVN